MRELAQRRDEAVAERTNAITEMHRLSAQLRDVERNAEAQVAVLAEALEKLRRPHAIVDDCWYSCPKSGECCDDSQDKDKCTCGADDVNAIIAAALRRVPEGVASHE